jgi:hypothetical protein
MKPVAAVVAGALISGVTMYTVGARTATVDAFTQPTGLVQSVERQYVPAVQPAPVQQLRSAAPAARLRTVAASQRTVYHDVAPDRAPVSVERAQPQRTWQKTALIIGGSAASGAGVGAIVHGKKGAIVGAAIGGGAASIYEATRRR